jgi:SAM-dependent methyltransferase
MKTRVRVDELLDDPALDRRSRDLALAGLVRLNQWSRSHRLLWSGLASLAREANAQGRVLRVVDIAAGSGDAPIALAQWAARAGLRIRWTLCDLHRDTLAVASARARQAGIEVDTVEADVIARPLPCRGDVVTCSLFVHHCERDEAVRVLGHMREAADRAVGVTDLDRTRPGLALAWLGARVLSRSPIVHFDAPVSVRAAFTRAEAAGLAHDAGLDGARIERAWPERWRLWWRRP